MKYLLSVLGILCISYLIIRLEIMELQIKKLSYIAEQKFPKIEKTIENLYEILESSSKSNEVISNKIENTIMTDINGVANICNTNADKSLLCTNIVLPTSCADSSSKACSDNKCTIQNSLLGSNAFLVSCNNTVANGGWTVIQRRINGSVNFLRDWDDYKRGFGDLDGEFWLGLDKIHALTTTLAPMELLVELIDFDNVAKYAKYDTFAVGDEDSQYLLQSLGTYSGDAGDALRYHERMKFSAKDRDNDNYVLDNCVNVRDGGWWFDNCSMSNLNGRYYEAGNKPVPGAHNGVTWYLFHDSDYSMKSVQMMIRPRKNSRLIKYYV